MLKDLEGKKLFTSASLSAISNLNKHISVSCLPGGGINCNERFHGYLKNFFHQSRVGVCLLTVINHSHNSAWTRVVSSGEAPTPAGISVFAKRNWDGAFMT